MNKTEKAILKVIAFFDLSQKALELEEVWQFLHRTRSSKVQVLIGLQNLEKEGVIAKENELYFLAGRTKVLDKMAEREKLQAERMRKVEQFAKLFSYAPFVQNISVTGSLATGTSLEDSDINLLIIARKHRAWLAKTFVTMILETFGQNKSRWYRANKFSVNIVLDESRLDLGELKLKKDDYLAYWLANLVPVLDRGVYKKLIEENSWIYREFPNWQAKEVESRSVRYTFLEKFLLSDRVLNFWARAKKFEQIKTRWNFLKIKSREIEKTFFKANGDLKRKEHQNKLQKVLEKVAK